MGAEQIYQSIRDERLIAIVRGVSAGTILHIADALLAGGIRLMEITCNTAGVTEMLAEVSQEMEGRMLIGAGTVITRELAEQVNRAGARYIVAPDVNPEVITYCLENDLAVLPGAATPTEILTAYRLGTRMVKLFPARPLGLDYVKQLRGPIDDMDFVAVGGVDAGNLRDFLRAGCVGAGLGGSLVDKELVARKDWDALTRLAQEYVRIAQGT